MSEVQGMHSQGQFQVFGVVAKLLRRTDLETDFGICSAKDFNGFMKQLQKHNVGDVYPPDSLKWLFAPDGLQRATIPFPFGLVALCEASTCLKQKTHGSLLHLCEQAGKQISRKQFFNYCYHIQAQRGMHPARCTQVTLRQYVAPESLLVEGPESTLLAVCERAAEDLEIELEVATDTRASPKEAARGPGVHPLFADQCHYK